MADNQVGVLACSGEECLGGTLSRMATRIVLEKDTVGEITTLCLPLYIAGGEEERDFAKEYPVISVDGCNKHCAKRATIKFSGEIKDSIDISELLGEDIALSKTVSARNITDEHHKMAEKIAGEIRVKINNITGKKDDGNKRMLAEFFPEFVEKLDEIDKLYTDKRTIDEKTYQFICFALSIKGRSKPCVLKHFKGALDAGATVQELSYIFALTMREAAGADDCWTHDVLGDWKDIVKGTVDCGCPK